MKKMFAGYCAFAPHISLAACVTLFRLGVVCEETMWLLAGPVCLACVPLSIVLVLLNIYNARSEKVGLIAATMGIEAHFSFYIHLNHLTTMVNTDDSLPNSFPFMMTIMGSLILSGASLLLLWDNDMRGRQ